MPTKKCVLFCVYTLFGKLDIYFYIVFNKKIDSLMC